MLSIVVMVLGVFFALAVTATLAPEEESDQAALLTGALWAITMLMIGVLAMLPLGRSAWRSTFPLAMGDRAILLGLGMGVVALAFNAAFVEALNAAIATSDALEEDLEQAFTPSTGVLLVTIVLLPAVIEELLDRGVMWTAIRRIAGVSETIVATALVFGFLHGLNGAGLLEVPHRFVMGCLLGWLRAKTGSIGPCMLAHGVNNLVAVLVWGG